MRLEERSYSSKVRRPRPLVFEDPAGDFILIVTIWGATDRGAEILEHVKSHLQTVRQDSELTTPFQNILTLSDEANDLRVATLLLNDFVFRGVNREKYEIVVETCFLTIKKRQVAWSQFGCPHLFLRKKRLGLQPISSFPESRNDLQGCPIPNSFLGTEPTISPRCGDLYLEKGDELILLSSSTVSSLIWSPHQELDLVNLTESIAATDESQAFWLGRIKID